MHLFSLFFISSLIYSSISTKHQIHISEEGNVSYEIPTNDETTIIFKGTGILNRTIAKYAQNKKKIIIEEGILEVSDKAFYQSSLHRPDEEFKYEEVELPCSLIRIGYLSFKTQGHELTRVHFPEQPKSHTETSSFYSLRDIGDYAFSGQPLRDHNIPCTFTTIGNNAFESTLITHIEFNNEIDTIPRYCFLRCFLLVSVDLPSSLTRISASSFECCFGLERISFESSEIREVGYNSFYGCSSLTEIVFPFHGSGFSEIGFIFEHCSSLRRCILPQEIEGNFGRGTFLHCTSLSEVSLPSNLSVVGSDMFRNTSIEFAYLPSSVCEIGKNAFSDCKRLRFVHLSHVGEIILGSEVFAGSDNIEVAVIEGNISELSERKLRARVLCYNGQKNPSTNDDAIDTSKTTVYLTNDFLTKNTNSKFGNTSNFEGYEYKIQEDGICRLPKPNETGSGGKDKKLTTLTIVLIVVCCIAGLAIIIVAVIAFIVIKKKRTNNNVIDQGLISENI